MPTYEQIQEKYNKYKDNYDSIDWSSVRKNKRQKQIDKQHKNEMYKNQ